MAIKRRHALPFITLSSPIRFHPIGSLNHKHLKTPFPGIMLICRSKREERKEKKETPQWEGQGKKVLWNTHG